MISMAIADGEFSESERQEILSICQEEGISEVKLMDSIRGKQITVPKTKEEQFNYIAHLIKVMAVDDYCSPLEIHTLEVLGKRIGYSRMKIFFVILTEMKQDRLSKAEGLKLLDWYVNIAMAMEG